MKMYTNESQTAKLTELGFEKPKASHRYWRENELIINNNYSIGELIEMLPDYINGNFVNWKIDTTRGDVKWSVGWDCFETGQFQWIRTTELVDALYNMVVKLKEEGVI